MAWSHVTGMTVDIFIIFILLSFIFIFYHSLYYFASSSLTYLSPMESQFHPSMKAQKAYSNPIYSLGFFLTSVFLYHEIQVWNTVYVLLHGDRINLCFYQNLYHPMPATIPMAFHRDFLLFLWGFTFYSVCHNVYSE